MILSVMMALPGGTCLASDYDKCMDAAGGVDPAMIECGGQELERRNADLNRAYKALSTKVVRGEVLAHLRTSERSWMKFRDDECDLIGAAYGDGSLTKILFQQCLIDATKTRTKTLENYLQQPDFSQP
ncbi:lysozyme inhibitor LprI family protein [Acetobacter nitrogenifigens]|uniref:lysozyme inhibitor LprI family protein n=1 Tax=Acetobacter nitrogenifigens TaxID=285268 RepID=UPI00042548AF|nr:lysozyme inhibitor LprI family protein [Acetobacter nitrogenifigens]